MLFKNKNRADVAYSIRTKLDAQLIFNEPKKIKTNFETKCPAHIQVGYDTYALLQPYNVTFEVGHNHFVFKEGEVEADRFFTISSLRYVDNVLSLQLNYPFYFITDDKDLFMESLPPDYKTKHVLPKTDFIRGGFKPYAWVRPIHPAFHFNIKDDSIVTCKLKKNQPICYVKFNKNVNMKYKAWDDKLEREALKVHNITDLVSGTQYLYDLAIKRRPKKLL